MVERLERGRRTGDINAVGDFQISVRRVVVTNETSVVAPKHDRGVPPDIPGTVQRADRRGGAHLVRAVGNFQVLVGRIIVTNEAELVGPDGDRRIQPGIAGAVSSHKRESRTLESAVICSGSKG